MKAKSLLGLREKSSLSEIKSNYKTLMKKWHPDKNKNNIEEATKISTQINEAYKIIMDYCNNYEYPFDEESIKKNTYTKEQWWNDKFGDRHSNI